MIIDLICDRMNGTQKYNAQEFYAELMQYGKTWPAITEPITRAMDGGTEQDVISELCNYIQEQQWNPQLCEYISSVKWLEDDPEHSFLVRVTFPRDRQQRDGTVKPEPFTFTFWQSFEEMLGGETEQEKNAHTIAPFKRAVSLADRMGWGLWVGMDIEFPHLGTDGEQYRWHLGPKDAESAEWIKRTLTEAKQRQEHWQGEVKMEPTTSGTAAAE